MNIPPIALVVLSYLLGSLPSGYMIARLAKGIDIREHGSGNPGAANVYRIVGSWAGWLTFALDAAKGFVSVWLALHFFPNNSWLAITCGSVAILGHMWTIFLKFKGGKGVATAAGVFGAMLPFPTLIAFVTFIVAVAISGHISVGSIIAAFVLPVASFAMRQYSLEFCVTVSLVAGLIIIRHIPNIRRLLQKKELAFEDGAKKDADKKAQ